MSVEILPATLLDVAELAGAHSLLQWRIAREMFDEGVVWAAWSDGRLLAIAGLYPLSETAAEAWFNVSPAAAAQMLPIIRATRLTIRASGYREIVTVARTPAGRRIARAVGMTPFQTTENGEVWQCQKCSTAAKPPESSKRRSSRPSSA